MDACACEQDFIENFELGGGGGGLQSFGIEHISRLFSFQSVKTQLELTTKQLKQAKEEGDMIRADLKKMIKQYQVTNNSILYSVALSCEPLDQAPLMQPQGPSHYKNPCRVYEKWL